MTDTEQLSYFTDVLKRLDALRDQATKDQDGYMAKLATEASEPIGILVGCLLADSQQYPGRLRNNA
jgi:hypothetical protein